MFTQGVSAGMRRGVLGISSCLINDIFLKMHQNTLKREYFCWARRNEHKYITFSEKYTHSDLHAYSLHCKRVQAIEVLVRVVVHI